MAQVRRIRERHGDVKGGHGQGSNKVALEKSPAVLGDPLQEGKVVNEVPVEMRQNDE